MIERQLPKKWQGFFEKALQINSPDIYQFHCFLVKTNKFFQQQPRFFVLSMVFMYNTKCAFNKKTGGIEFGEM